MNYAAGYRPKPGGSYESCVIRGQIAYVAIQFPIEMDRLLYRGRLGENLTTEEGIRAAELCAVNVLRQLAHAGCLHRIAGMNHMDVYYQAANDWDEAPLVADGASRWFLSQLHEAGRHTRALVGVAQLPRNFSVGISASFTLMDGRGEG